MARPSAVVPGLLAARVRHAGRRRLLVAAGLAVAAVLPVLAAALTATTTDAALRRGLAARPVGERSVIVSYNSPQDAAELAFLDATVRRELPRLTSDPVRRQLIFRAFADTRGGDYVLAAADDLAGVVRVVDGRLPASCTPSRCEVVSLAAPGRDPFLPPELGIVVVGHAVRTDPLLLAGTFDPGPDARVLLAGDVAKASAVTSLGLRQRTVGWFAPLDLGQVRRVGVEAWIDRSARVADDLRTARTGIVLTTLDDVLRAENARATASAGRFAVLGGATAVLLLGTAVVGGAALRRDHETFVGALRRRGAPPGVLRLLLAGEVLLAAAGGTLLGLAAGAGAAATVAASAGLDVVAVTGASVLAALPVTLGLAVAAAGLLAVTLAAPAGPSGGAPPGVWRAVEAGALGCAAVAVLVASRGGVGVAGSTGDPLLVALPVLVLVAGALGLARVWPVLTRLAQRAVPRGALAARLGLAAAAGRPLRPVATAAVLTAAVAASVFAGAYRATLDRGAADQAAFAVPTDARLETGRDLTRPVDAAPPDVVVQRLPGAVAYPVLRAAGAVQVTSSEGSALAFVGVDPGVLSHVARWDAVTGGTVPAADLARGLATTGPAAVPDGVRLPPGRTLTIATTGDRVRVAVTAVVRADDGREAGVALQVSPDGAPPALGADLTGPVGSAPGPGTWRDAAGAPAVLHLVALVVRQPADEATRTQHALGERTRDLTVPSGSFGLGAASVDGTTVPAPWRGWTGTGLVPAADGASATFDYRILSGAVNLTARADGPGTPALPLAVAVDPVTARLARGGLVPLVLDRRTVVARVVAVLPRFPTAPDGRFAVADLTALGRLVDLDEPGAAGPTEYWLALRAARPVAGQPVSVTTAHRTLAAAPFDRLAVRERPQVQRDLATDPVAVGARGLLALGALLTLLVAVAALVLLVAAEASDDAAQAYAWEADGVAPSTLRGALWWRAAAVALPAVPAGVLVGAVLSRATSQLVAVTATAATPRPPLVPGTGIGWGLVAVVVGVAAALALAAGVAARTLREPLPVRDAGVIR